MKSKKIIWGTVLVIATAIFIFCCYLLLSQGSSDGGNTKKYLTETTSRRVKNSKEYADSHNINWKKLKKDNSDIYSWIYIPNTKVDYPVVQPTTDNDDFYLNHNIQKKSEFAGAIYSEMQNATDYSITVNTLILHLLVLL